LAPECVAGQTENRACGQCGTQTRTCLPNARWGNFDPCGDEGVCAPGDAESRNCGASDVGECVRGLQTRTCSGQCAWNAWDACRGNVDPRAEVCGDALDQDCDGQADRDPDGYEPNDSCDRCTVIQGTDPNAFLDATHDAVADREDYYCFDASDGFSVPGFQEHVRVDLENVPNGMDLDLFLYFNVADCRAERPLASSTAGGSADESIDWTERLNVDDGGRYVVRVKRFTGNDCNRSYRLTINGLN
jgi:hypothetical protein